MYQDNRVYVSILCCGRMLYSRAYLYGQVHSTVLRCTKN